MVAADGAAGAGDESETKVGGMLLLGTTGGGGGEEGRGELAHMWEMAASSASESLQASSRSSQLQSAKSPSACCTHALRSKG